MKRSYLFFAAMFLEKIIAFVLSWTKNISWERSLFIRIRVVHSDALSTAINWRPDKNKIINNFPLVDWFSLRKEASQDFLNVNSSKHFLRLKSSATVCAEIKIYHDCKYPFLSLKEKRTLFKLFDIPILLMVAPDTVKEDLYLLSVLLRCFTLLGTIQTRIQLTCV